jgi:hypothetical protein
MLYGGLEHLMWPVLFGKHRVDVELIADHYTDLMLDGLQARGKSVRSSVESRLARLEALVAPPPATQRRARTS